jgi:hypothetical protein
MWRHRVAQLAAALAMAALSPICAAQQLNVGSGASFSLGSSVLDAGCHDLHIAGTLDLGNGTLENVRDVGAGGTLLGGTGTLVLSGDLALGASLQAQNGTVRVADGCGRAQTRVTGDHQFNRLSIGTDTGHSLLLPAGGTQSIASTLDLTGGTQRLILRSSAPGVVSFLALANAATQSIFRVDVKDVGAPAAAQYLAPYAPSFYDSLDQGNTPRFFFGPEDMPATPVPVMSPTAVMLLLLSIFGVAAFQLRKPEQGLF